jgi:hypothetical protein
MDIKKATYRDRPTDKALSFSWSWRPKSLEQLDDAIRLTARIRDVRVVRGFVLGRAIKVFREDPQRWISYSRNKNWYRWAMRSRYWPVRNMYASMISAVDQSAAAGLIENHIAPRGNLGEQSRFRATSKLIALVEESRISLILDRPEIIILRDADKQPISYDETRVPGPGGWMVAWCSASACLGGGGSASWPGFADCRLRVLFRLCGRCGASCVGLRSAQRQTSRLMYEEFK